MASYTRLKKRIKELEKLFQEAKAASTEQKSEEEAKAHVQPTESTVPNQPQ